MLRNRSYQPELLDNDNIPVKDLYQNLVELNIINTWLGGHDITLAGMTQIIKGSNKTSFTVADVGCGGGDNLKALAKWGRKYGIQLKFTGIDLKQDCITFGQENCKDFPEINFICSDYKHVDENFDIVMCALFCHHLNDQQMVEYLKWSYSHANIGCFI